MGKNKCLSPTKRAQIVAHSQHGMSQRAIAQLMQCSKTAVQHAISQFSHRGSFEDRRRSGRPRVTSIRQDRIIRRNVVSNPLVSTRLVQQHVDDHGSRVSIRTIRNRLREVGLRAYRLARKPLTTSAMKEK